MACKTETTLIEGIEYSATQWPADKSMVMKMRLVKVLGPALTTLLQVFSKGEDEEGDSDNVNIDAFSGSMTNAIHALFQTSNPEEVAALIEECVLGVAIHGHPDMKDGTRMTKSHVNQIFSGDSIYSLYRLFFFVVKVNYLGFMKGRFADGILARLSDKMMDAANRLGETSQQ